MYGKEDRLFGLQQKDRQIQTTLNESKLGDRKGVFRRGKTNGIPRHETHISLHSFIPIVKVVLPFFDENQGRDWIANQQQRVEEVKDSERQRTHGKMRDLGIRWYNLFAVWVFLSELLLLYKMTSSCKARDRNGMILSSNGFFVSRVICTFMSLSVFLSNVKAKTRWCQRQTLAQDSEQKRWQTEEQTKG